jgi:uncharacterized protein YceK
MNRRKYMTALCGIGTVSISGCSTIMGGSEPKHEITRWDAMERTETENQSDGAETWRYEGRVSLTEGQYVTKGLEAPNDETGIAYECTTNGNAVDIFFNDRDEYDFRNRDGDIDIEYNSQMSDLATTSVTKAREFSRGGYTLVVDNTKSWGTEPEGVAGLDIQIAVATGF